MAPTAALSCDLFLDTKSKQKKKLQKKMSVVQDYTMSHKNVQRENV